MASPSPVAVVDAAESDSEKLLLDSSSEAAGSEWSTPTETSVASADYANPGGPWNLEEDENDMRESMGAATGSRGSFKVAKGLPRTSSSKLRRNGLAGADPKKNFKKLRSLKLMSLEGSSSSSRKTWSSSHDQPSSSPYENHALPNYLKATRSSNVRKVSNQSSTRSTDQEGEISNASGPTTARNKPLAGTFRRTVTLRPLRLLAKIPSLKPKRPSSRKCSDISNSSVQRATCSSAIKDSKFPGPVENQQGGDVSEKISSAAKTCPYSYCSLHGHRHAAPTLQRLRSARKRVKSQRSKKSDGLSRIGANGFAGVKIENESTQEIDSDKSAGLHDDDRQERVEEADEVAFPKRKQKRKAAKSALAGHENLYQASDSSSADQNCLELFSMNQEIHIDRESGQDTLESINVGKKENKESGGSPGSGGRKFVSIGIQTDLELEDLGDELSVADHTASDPHEKTPEVVETVQETGDELIHGFSTHNNEQSNSSREVERVLLTEDLTSELQTPGELEESLLDSRDETTLLGDKTPKSPKQPREALSDSSEEPTLGCNMDENLGSPAESQLDKAADDPFKSSFGRRKFNGLWFLIYQHMVSDVAENGGLESPVARDDRKEQVINADTLPELDRNPEVANHDEPAQQEEIQQSDAIKLLQEAIGRILEQNQEESSMYKSTADNLNFNKTEAAENQSTDCRSETELGLDDDKREAHKQSTIEEKRWINAGGRPNELASQRWSSLKKYILMRRFIKAMEKTKNFSRRIQQLPSAEEVCPEQEKVSLRRQSIGDRKNAEEWMLDHALQKVISKLDPVQKRRVALLVKAFETVNPIPGGKTRLSMNSGVEKLYGSSEATNRDPKESEELIASPSEHPNKLIFARDQSGLENRPVPPQLTMDKEKTEHIIQVGSPGEGTVHEMQRKEIQGSNSQLESGSDEMNRKRDCVESTAVEVSISSSAGHDELRDPTLARDADNGAVKLMTVEEPIEDTEEDGEAVLEKQVVSRSSQPEECRSSPATDIEDEPQSEKKKFTGLWYLIYKHMASGLATAQESEPLDPLVDGDKRKEDEEEAENEDDRKEMRSADVGSPDTLGSDHYSEEMKLRKVEAIKLVQQAIDEILLECEDSSPHNQVNASNGVLNLELKGESRSYGETSFPTSTDSSNNNYMHFGKVREHKPLLDPETQLKSCEAPQEAEPAGLQEANRSNPRPMKNWNNLRKVILLKRFVKALEKVRDFNPREPRHLPLDPDMEPEEVSLKHQDMDERKRAEEYLLDYALQRVVSRLTPARKRKVHLLVEAFETVAPPIRS